VELARFELSLATLEGLKTGDSVPLGVVRDVCARVNARPSFYGEAGSSGGMRSLKIGRRANGPSTVSAKDR
jgi:flagellar motor switch protein FliM